MDRVWPVQDAKARFSEFLREAESRPQIITNRGELKFDVRLIGDKATGKERPRTLVDCWLSAPRVPEFRLPPRKRQKPRKVL